MSIKNRGVLLGQKTTDYIAGVNSPLPYEIIDEAGDWRDDLPTPEKQWGITGDKMNCVTQSAHNSMEARLIKLRTLGRISDIAWKWMGDNGYLNENGKPNFNDRIAATLNETTHKGNYLYKVMDKAREYGLFPESVLPSDEDLIWEEYYNRDLITADILKLGLESKKYLECFYEWIPLTFKDLIKHIKQAPPQVVIPGHAIVNIFNKDQIVTYFDTYDPFVKDTPFSNLQAAMKIIINEKNAMKLIKDKGIVYLIAGTNKKRKIGIADGVALDKLFGDEPVETRDTSGIKQTGTATSSGVLIHEVK